jgi:hypothetical protein
VTKMQYMFLITPFNQDLSSWYVSSVTNVESMHHPSTKPPCHLGCFVCHRYGVHVLESTILQSKSLSMRLAPFQQWPSFPLCV